jgi:hypothetical protein
VKSLRSGWGPNGSEFLATNAEKICRGLDWHTSTSNFVCGKVTAQRSKIFRLAKKIVGAYGALVNAEYWCNASHATTNVQSVRCEAITSALIYFLFVHSEIF